MHICEEQFGKTPEGYEITRFTLKNDSGASVQLLNWGACVTAVNVPDRDGRLDNVNLGFPDLAGYLDNPPYFGAIIGRYGNRIGHGKFSIDGNEYALAKNNGPHHLHGGLIGFSHKVWQAAIVEEKEYAGVEFRLVSPDGDEGYPGELAVTVTYTFNEEAELAISYSAKVTGKPTVVSLTNHCYWNLHGVGDDGGSDNTPDVLDHELTLNAGRYLAVDSDTLPTGELLFVDSTPFDFRTPKALGEQIEMTGDGYDHCFVLDGDDQEVSFAARIASPKSGRVMEILTTEPGVQLYTANYLDSSPGTNGFGKHQAFCLECQHFPDSPNKPDFPSTLLQPGETYRQTTIHRFGTT